MFMNALCPAFFGKCHSVNDRIVVRLSGYKLILECIELYFCGTDALHQVIAAVFHIQKCFIDSLFLFHEFAEYLVDLIEVNSAMV